MDVEKFKETMQGERVDSLKIWVDIYDKHYRALEDNHPNKETLLLKRDIALGELYERGEIKL